MNILRFICTMYTGIPCIPTWTHIAQHTQSTMYIFVITWLLSDVLHWMESARVFTSCDLHTAPLRATGRSRSTYWSPLVYIFGKFAPRAATTRNPIQRGLWPPGLLVGVECVRGRRHDTAWQPSGCAVAVTADGAGYSLSLNLVQ